MASFSFEGTTSIKRWPTRVHPLFRRALTLCSEVFQRAGMALRADPIPVHFVSPLFRAELRMVGGWNVLDSLLLRQVTMAYVDADSLTTCSAIMMRQWPSFRSTEHTLVPSVPIGNWILT